MSELAERITWERALATAGCYGFLEPLAAQAVGEVLGSCPDAAALLDDTARTELRALCLKRLSAVYERPLMARALKLANLADTLAINRGGEERAETMLRIAGEVRDEVAADDGTALRERLPLSSGYERAIADNFIDTMVEFLERFLRSREEISRELIDGRTITRIDGISASGADPHRHGRMVMRVFTDAGTVYYKPHDCSLDALYAELVRAFFPGCARAAKVVQGDGYAFVECLVPEELSSTEQLRTYWRNFGCLTALFHALGSRDMTQDNIMCCGTMPAVLDLETLLVGEMIFAQERFGGADSARLADSIVCTGVLPERYGTALVSPLVADNTAGTCLPRMGGNPCTVAGFEQDFAAGFEEGYRHLMSRRDEVIAMLGRYVDATCRQILLNTWAYVRFRSLLFSPCAMSDPARRDEVLEKLNASYAGFSEGLPQAVAAIDAAALAEGDIPYYCSKAGSRTLFAGDGHAVGNYLARSALEVAGTRLARLSEQDLRDELDLIRTRLGADAQLGGTL